MMKENGKDAVKQCSVLVVDDEAVNLHTVSEMLHGTYDLFVAPSGRKALEVVAASTPDIILLDIMMPDIDGFEVARRLNEDPETAHIPVIFVTSDTSSKTIIEALRLGGADFIVKPFTEEELQNRVGRVCRLLMLERQQEAAKKLLIEQQKELQKLNAELQERVALEVERNREKDRMLYNQAKSAQMGEMLNMIAHQWRQPLNAISASAISIAMKQEIDTVTEKDLLDHANFVQELTQKMSKTVNDFMNFFKPAQEKATFLFSSLLESITSILGAQLQNRGIELVVHAEENYTIDSYDKELSHILINLIANARDAYHDHPSNNQKIEVGLHQDGEHTIIDVIDHAGGIPEEIIDKIFDPYFTTKEQGKGTGIGLYMSRRMVHEILGGTLEVCNYEDGAKFSIVLPLSMPE